MIVFTKLFTENTDIGQLIKQWGDDRDQAEANSKRSDKRRQEFLSARACLRALLFHVTKEKDWRIVPNAKGKPFAMKENGSAGPHISLSHTKGLIAAAASTDFPVGIDAEFHRPRDFNALASYSFGTGEQKSVTEKGAARFYRIWTLKEALAKARGRTLFDILNSSDDFVEQDSAKYFGKAGCQFLSFSPAENYSLSLAVISSELNLETHLSMIEFDKL